MGGESRWEEGEHSLHDPIRDNTDKTSPEANLPHSSKTLRPFARYRRLCDAFYPSYETVLPSENLINNTPHIHTRETNGSLPDVVDVHVKLGKMLRTPTKYSRRFFVGFWYEFVRRSLLMVRS